MTVCIPVVESNIDDCIKFAESALKVGDIVEFRLDFIKDKIREEDIVRLSKYPSIITVRPKWEGGNFEGDDSYRLKILKWAIKNNVKYIDVELREGKNKDLVEYRDDVKSKTKIIISHHDFEKTPPKDELYNIVEEELKIGDIGKFATMVNKKEDILNILNTTLKYSNRVIGIGMGGLGKITRIIGLDFGSVLTFASLGKSSAPGQIDTIRLKEIRKLING